ncbi:MAG: transposase [Myxococcales bacterium]|nr:transposase [Myxococcales bacterium]
MVDRAAGKVSGYRRREPEKTQLHRVVQDTWLTFRDNLQGEGGFLPAFVAAEFEAYLGCGILGKGFVNVRCEACAETRLVAFSCKRRGFCPSCLGRRMAETAAHVVDNVFPAVPARQWVLTVPHALRYRMAREPHLASVVLRVFLREVSRWYRKRARKAGVRGALATGAVTVIQRFGSGLALNVHFHSVVTDGVFRVDTPGRPAFFATPPPRDEEVAEVTARIWEGVTRALASSEERDAADAEALSVIAGASVKALIATGRRRGQAVMRLGNDPIASWEPYVLGKQCAFVEGFNLHASTRIAANDRDGLERLIRYIARPPLSEDRLSELPDGRVAVRLKRPWRDGTTHVAFTPEEFIEKLVALVPRPRAQLVRYHGVFAPAAADRARIVPGGAGRKARRGCGKREGEGDGGEDHVTELRERGDAAAMSWAELMRRVFAHEVLVCPRCAGPMKVLGPVQERGAIETILAYKGLSAEVPTWSPARGPPGGTGETGCDSDLWPA